MLWGCLLGALNLCFYKPALWVLVEGPLQRSSAGEVGCCEVGTVWDTRMPHSWVGTETLGTAAGLAAGGALKWEQFLFWNIVPMHLIGQHHTAS